MVYVKSIVNSPFVFNTSHLYIVDKLFIYLLWFLFYLITKFPILAKNPN